MNGQNFAAAMERHYSTEGDQNRAAFWRVKRALRIKGQPSDSMRQTIEAFVRSTGAGAILTSKLCDINAVANPFGKDA